MEVKTGTMDQSVSLYAIDADGEAVSITAGVTSLSYERWLKGVRVGSVAFGVSYGADPTVAHADGRIVTLGNGEHRIDVPDAAWAAGADEVRLVLAHPGVERSYHERIDLVPGLPYAKMELLPFFVKPVPPPLGAGEIHTYQIDVWTYDVDGLPVAIGPNAMSATGVSGVNLSGNLSGMTTVSPGHYRWGYTVQSGHATQQVWFGFGGVTALDRSLTAHGVTQVVDHGFLDSDRTLMHTKLGLITTGRLNVSSVVINQSLQDLFVRTDYGTGTAQAVSFDDPGDWPTVDRAFLVLKNIASDDRVQVEGVVSAGPPQSVTFSLTDEDMDVSPGRYSWALVLMDAAGDIAIRGSGETDLRENFFVAVP